ncbi:MAG TPA: right-handed parallel beta-helix repeat-containing protein [Anaerolineales bacterium]|nr:right-handed parallel beta-helix repeat-containing protein [Anaerolineales bacterium]
MVLLEDTDLEEKPYALPGGLDFDADGITLDGKGATLAGNPGEGTGIRIAGRRNIVVRNLSISGYRHGISISGSADIRLENVRIFGTAEIPHSTVFLDIFHVPGSYGGGVLVQDSEAIDMDGCDLSHQLCGLLGYDSRHLNVQRCTANYCSGFGFYLSGIRDSTFADNDADFCCRWQPRDGGAGHMGADAAGFVLVRGASGNTFQGNKARMGGDGFFLAGLTHHRVLMPCNDNRFLGNDASWSPNIGFEATFSSGNIFKDNIADHCNYGFWLGFSQQNLLEGNTIRFNRQAGIAVENGIDMEARGNRFIRNGHGILLWSRRIPEFDAAVPENDTSRDWTITGNEFDHNGTAVRIAADQDHGIVPFTTNGPAPPLGAHRVMGNTCTGNRVDLDVPEDP